MSFFNEILPATALPTARASTRSDSSILGATGLSRPQLAALFREQGLFGRESNLSPAEQALVQNRLGDIPGLRPRPATTWLTPRLRALAQYTDARIAQREPQSERAQLEAMGLSRAAIREVDRLVEDVRVVFGLRPQAVPSDQRLPATVQRSLAPAA